MRGKVVVGVSVARAGGDAGDLSLPIVVVGGQNGSSRARSRSGRPQQISG
jgi:hypothetical protein